MKLKLFIGIISCCFTVSVFALDSAVKEETNPPAPETAITPEQIPPMLTTQSP